MPATYFVRCLTVLKSRVLFLQAKTAHLMRQFLTLFLFCCCAVPVFSHAQCTFTQSKIKVVLKTDNYPSEIQWKITNSSNAVLKQSPANMQANTVYQDSVCVPSSGCHLFNITDAASDGICCGYGYGSVRVYVNGALVFADSTYGAVTSHFIGCPGGTTCGSGFVVSAGMHTAPSPNTWYKFTPPATGMYEVKTCGLGNSCNTKLWMYDYCTNLVPDTSNAATIYYAMANCGRRVEEFDGGNSILNVGAYVAVGVGHVEW